MKNNAEPLKHSYHFRAFKVKFRDSNEHFLPTFPPPSSVTEKGEATVYNVCMTNKMCVHDEEQADTCLCFLWEAELRSFRFSVIQMVPVKMEWDTDKEYAGKKVGGVMEAKWNACMILLSALLQECIHWDDQPLGNVCIIAQGGINSSSTSTSTEPECGLIRLGREGILVKALMDSLLCHLGWHYCQQ